MFSTELTKCGFSLCTAWAIVLLGGVQTPIRPQLLVSRVGVSCFIRVFWSLRRAKYSTSFHRSDFDASRKRPPWTERGPMKTLARTVLDRLRCSFVVQRQPQFTETDTPWSCYPTASREDSSTIAWLLSSRSLRFDDQTTVTLVLPGCSFSKATNMKFTANTSLVETHGEFRRGALWSLGHNPELEVGPGLRVYKYHQDPRWHHTASV